MFNKCAQVVFNQAVFVGWLELCGGVAACLYPRGMTECFLFPSAKEESVRFSPQWMPFGCVSLPLASSEHFPWQTASPNHISKFTSSHAFHLGALHDFFRGRSFTQTHTHPSTDLLKLCESGFVMNVRRDKVKLVLFCQYPQQQNHRPTSTLAHPVVDHLTWER